MPVSEGTKQGSAKRTSTPQERLDYWSQFFEKAVDPEVVHDLVEDLVDNKKYDEVIVCIEQAILHGQIQPWMYQVLALSMQLAGRPEKQIERVMLSSQDVILNDPRSMMHLAAYLVRFDRFDRALELYRQAAALDPTRPEAYVLALQIAAKTRNYKAVAWSAPEVLAFSWSKGREQLNRLAEESAAEAEAAFFKSGDFEQALRLRTDMQNARRLDLAIRLEWSGQGDLDLQIREPGGTVCSLMQPVTSAGGIFVHDGFGPIQDHCYEEYLCPIGLAGEYQVIVKHAAGTIVGKRARILITRDRGTANEETVSETLFLGPTDQTMRFSLSGGRRLAGHVEKRTGELRLGPNPAVKQSPLAQLAPGGGLAQIAQSGAAIGFTPITTQISEGVRMSALATVSGDRRYVRLNVAPVFSAITDVFTFTFQH